MKYILCPTTGLDHIRISNKGIRIISLVPARIPDIRASSEFTVFLILYLLRQGYEVASGVLKVGEELFGKTVGIVGYGRIGKNVATYVQSFGCPVLKCDTSDKEGMVPMDYLLENSDVVVISVTANEANRNLISEREFELMSKRKPYFVNVSRGFIVNDKALRQALERGYVAGAGLDVVDKPEIYGGYAKSNLIMTPHVAGSTKQSRKKACDFVIAELRAILEQQCEN